MRTSTRFLIAVPLLSIFTAASLSAALAEDHKKGAGKAPAVQMKADKGGKGVKAAGGNAKGFSGAGRPDSAAETVGGAVGGTVGDAVGGTVGSAVGGAIGGLLGAFGPK
jgi:hypothetical protein